MPRRSTQKPRTERLFPEAERKGLPAIPAAAALSFLRETRGVVTWTVRDMAKSLNVSPADAKQIAAILELQGYVKAAAAGEWMTTTSGEEVSGSREPRYTQERIEEALSSLGQRIAQINRDSTAPYKIMEAAAFGDFLSERSRLQAADVGIQLAPRKPGQANSDSAREHKARQEFLKRLQGRSSLVHLRAHEKWMSARTHRSLL